MATMTVLIDVPDGRASEAFREIVSECAEQLISADEPTLTVCLRDGRDQN